MSKPRQAHDVPAEDLADLCEELGFALYAAHERACVLRERVDELEAQLARHAQASDA
jgi:hypothetical protein